MKRNLTILFATVLATAAIARPGSPAPAPAVRAAPAPMVRTNPIVQPPRPSVTPQQTKMAGTGYQRQFSTPPVVPQAIPKTQPQTQQTYQQRPSRQVTPQSPNISPTTAGVGGAVVGGLVGYALGSSNNNTPTQQTHTAPAQTPSVQQEQYPPNYRTPDYQAPAPTNTQGYYPPPKYSSGGNGWLWFIGIVLVLCGVYLFFRNHAKGKKVYEQYVDPYSKTANWSNKQINDVKHDTNAGNIGSKNSVSVKSTPTFEQVVGTTYSPVVVNKHPVKLTFDVNSDAGVVLNNFKRNIEANFKEVFDNLQTCYMNDNMFSVKNVSPSYVNELSQARIHDTDVIVQPVLVSCMTLDEISYEEVEGSLNWVVSIVVSLTPNPEYGDVVTEIWNYKFNNLTSQWELVGIQV